MSPFAPSSGEALQRHALFEALQEHFFRADPAVWGWPVWPEDYRHPEAPAVRRFAEQQRARVRFFEYVQWLCDEQLGAVARRASALGIGLYKDLAVAADRAGADSWSDQDGLALEASIGAPPDEFNPAGQNWGLPPLDSARARARRLRAVRADAARRHARTRARCASTT